MKKNLFAFLIFSIIILVILGIDYNLKGEENKTANNQELKVTLSGGERIIRSNIQEIIFFKTEKGEIKYFQVTYNEKKNLTELYHLARIASLSYNPKLKEKITTKPLSKLKLPNKN